MKLTSKPPFFLREKLQAITADHAKGLFNKDTPFTPPKAKDYYQYYGDGGDSVVTAAINSKVNAAVGRGFDLEVDEDSKTGDDEKELCEEFSKLFNLDDYITNVGRNTCVAGYCPVETELSVVLEKCSLRMVHPLTVIDLKWNEANTKPVTLLQQVGLEEASIPYEKLAWFSHNQMGNNPFGTSMVAPVYKYLISKNKAVLNMDKILERYASPKGIWKSRGDISQVKQVVCDSVAGEDIFLGMLPDDQLDKIVEFLQIDPRVRFWEYIQYIDQLIYVGLVAPNLFYFKDATEASARVLLEIVDRESFTFARMLKRVVENSWFKPLCKLSGYKSFPKVKWRERPANMDLNVAEILNKGLDKNFINQDQYFELINNLGISFDAKPTPPPAPVIPQPFNNNPQQEEQSPENPEDVQESYIVTPVKPRLMEHKHAVCNSSG